MGVVQVEALKVRTTIQRVHPAVGSKLVVPGFVSDWGDLREHNRRRRQAYVEDRASKDRPKMV